MASEKNNFVGDGFLECVYILDQSYTTKMIIDTFSDLLWVERYYGSGEFEITVPVNTEIVNNCRLKDYVTTPGSNVYMIVETIGVHTDPENGDTMVISGRSLESILDRRVILGKFKESGTEAKPINLQTAIKKMINENVMNPVHTKRKIPNFEFKESTDERVTSLTVEAIESTGGNIYSEVESLCKGQYLGFRVMPEDNGGFEFELYFGIDHSWDQDENPYVVFSDSYENLKNSDYFQSEKDYRSTVYIDSSDDGTDIKEVYRQPERIGLDRREVYVQDTSSTTDEAILEKAREVLSEYKVTKLFEGETEPSRQFVYGIDYFLGDIVQLENKYGQNGRCRVTEVTCSRDESGPSLVPTFEAIEEDEEE